MTPENDVSGLYAALSMAQSEMRGALKDSTGQVGQQKMRYADLASCWDACREALTRQGLCVIQIPSAEGAKVTVRTVLGHKSGQQITGELTLTSTQATPQGIGSAITYARRYGLCAMVGIAPEDDDGAAASRVNGTQKAADEVAGRKVQAFKNGVARNAPEELEITQEDSVQNDTWITKMMQAFTEVKTALGDDVYYTIMGREGYEHKSELMHKGRKEATRVYRVLADALIKIKADKAEQEAMEVA